MTVNNDVHTLTGAYVLDALSEMERRAFEDHMSGCPACYQEVAELRETTARLGAATSTYPPPQLWNKVLAATAHARQLPPSSHTQHNVVRPKRWTTRVAVFAAAASVVAAAGIGIGWYVTNNDLQGELAQSQGQLSKLEAVLTAPDARLSTGQIKGGGTVTAMISKSRNSMVMMVSDAPALQANQVYQAWYITPGSKITSAGLLASSTGSIVAEDLTPAAGATILGLTIEPTGGSAQPSSMDSLVNVAI